jgi:hypothetical protein
MAQLRNGTHVDDVRLDRIYELDWRSLNYAVGSQLLEVKYYRPRSYTWDIDAWLDQGTEGACVGFAFGHELCARPVEVKGVTDTYARSIYHDAQRIDPWQGGAYPGASPFYEGTSVLAGAQICQQRGFYESYYWAVTLEELVRGLSYFGPCVLGLDWYEGMFNTDTEGFLHPVGRIAGGHAILAHAVKIHYKTMISKFWWWRRSWADVDLERSYVVLHNSWSQSWGDNGKAKLSLADLNYLLQSQGDACFAKRTKKVSLV